MDLHPGLIVLATIKAPSGGSSHVALLTLERPSPTRPWWFATPVTGTTKGHAAGYVAPDGLLCVHPKDILREATTEDVTRYRGPGRGSNRRRR